MAFTRNFVTIQDLSSLDFECVGNKLRIIKCEAGKYFIPDAYLTTNGIPILTPAVALTYYTTILGSPEGAFPCNGTVFYTAVPGSINDPAIVILSNGTELTTVEHNEVCLQLSSAIFADPAAPTEAEITTYLNSLAFTYPFGQLFCYGGTTTNPDWVWTLNTVNSGEVINIESPNCIDDNADNIYIEKSKCTWFDNIIAQDTFIFDIGETNITVKDVCFFLNGVLQFDNSIITAPIPTGGDYSFVTAGSVVTLTTSALNGFAGSPDWAKLCITYEQSLTDLSGCNLVLNTFNLLDSGLASLCPIDFGLTTFDLTAFGGAAAEIHADGTALAARMDVLNGVAGYTYTFTVCNLSIQSDVDPLVTSQNIIGTVVTPVTYAMNIVDNVPSALCPVDFSSTSFDLTPWGGLVSESFIDGTALAARMDILNPASAGWSYVDDSGGSGNCSLTVDSITVPSLVQDITGTVVISLLLKVDTANGDTITLGGAADNAGTVDWGEGGGDVPVTSTYTYTTGFTGDIIFKNPATGFSTYSGHLIATTLQLSLISQHINANLTVTSSHPTGFTGNTSDINAAANYFVNGNNVITGLIEDAVQIAGSTGQLGIQGQNTISGSIQNINTWWRSLNIGGFNTIGGDIGLMNHANLQDMIITGNNVITGDFTTGIYSPTDFNTLRIIGANTISGDITTIPATLFTSTSPGTNTLDIDGLNTITGDLGIASLPNVELISIDGNNTISGSINSATTPKTSLFDITIAGNNSVGGNLQNFTLAFPALDGVFEINGSGNWTGYVSGTTFPDLPAFNIITTGTGFTSTEIDNLLIDLDTSFLGVNGSNVITLDNNHAAPTAASAAAILSLQGKGYVVNTN